MKPFTILAILEQFSSFVVGFSPPIILTAALEQGTYIGIDKGKGNTFYGIPYAQPPINDLRFRKPVELSPNPGAMFNATQPGNACVPKGEDLGRAPISEDCLNLNVFAPKGAKNLPVLVYFYGAAFAYGSIMQGQNVDYPQLPALYIYDAQRIINVEDVVVVTFNHRLGVLGFLSSLELQDQGLLNLGLQDSIMALKWVKKNIAAFGGDPDSITAIGHSSGGVMVGALLIANKGTQTLFNRGIMLSGAAPLNFLTAPDQQQYFKKFINKVGCGSEKPVLDCLRKADIKKLREAGDNIGYALTADPGVLPSSSLEALDAGEFSKVPIIINTNQDETRTFLGEFAHILGPLDMGNVTKQNFRHFLNFFSGKTWSNKQLNTLQDLYSNRGTPEYNLDTFIGDSLFKCSSSEMARAYADAGVPTYVSRFTGVPTAIRFIRKNITSFHGADMFYTWQSIMLLPTEWPLSKKVIHAYVNFARGLKPLDDWSSYGSQRSRYIMVDGTSLPDTDVTSVECRILVQFTRAAIEKANKAA